MLTMETKEFFVRGDGEMSRFDGWCLSTDEKPTQGVLNGSCLIEMDTGKVFFFDEEGAAWREFGSGESSSGSESSSGGESGSGDTGGEEAPPDDTGNEGLDNSQEGD